MSLGASSSSFTTLPAVKRGDTWSFVFQWKTGATPINLTGCTARMQIRKKRTKDLLAYVTTEDYITIDGPAGKVFVTFPADITETVPAGTHLTDVELTFTDGTVTSSQTVYMVVEEDITLP